MTSPYQSQYPQQPQQPHHQQPQSQYPQSYPQQQHPQQPQQPYPQHPQQSQQYPQYQQQQQPPAGGGDGHTAIAVTLKYHWLSFMLALFKPKVLLNGHELAGAWGRSVLPVQPGQHHLHVHVPYFLPPKIGPADLTVPVQAGQVVEVEYRAPMWAFSRGSLGPPPQQYNGAGVMIGIMVAIIVIFCLCCGIGLLGSLA